MTDNANDIREDNDVIIYGRVTELTDDLAVVVVRLDQHNEYKMQQLTISRSLLARADPDLTEHDRRIVEAAEAWRRTHNLRPSEYEDRAEALAYAVDDKLAALAPKTLREKLSAALDAAATVPLTQEERDAIFDAWEAAGLLKKLNDQQ